MTNYTTPTNASSARQERITQSALPTEDYRWQGDAIDPPIDVELFRKGQRVAAGKICQIGQHGLLVETHADFPAHTYLQARFAVPRNGSAVPYAPFGRVAHCARNTVGLLLDVLEPATRDALQALSAQAKRGTRSQEKNVRNLM